MISLLFNKTKGNLAQIAVSSIMIFTLLVIAGNLLIPATSSLHIPTYFMSSLFGKYFCYALLAVALNMVWGYCGILSLGHAAFFALGGYVMGMYLTRQIGPRGVYGDPILPDFMVFLNWKELPWFWFGVWMLYCIISMYIQKKSM